MGQENAALLNFEVVSAREVPSTTSIEILECWDRARGAKIAPEYGVDFFLDDLRLDIVPSISIVDVIDGGKDYSYRFWGSLNGAIKGFEMTGKRLSEGPFDEFKRFGYDQFTEIIFQRKPLTFTYYGPYKSSVRRRQVTSRFPFSSDGESIDVILSCQNLEQQSDEWTILFEAIRDEMTTKSESSDS